MQIEKAFIKENFFSFFYFLSEKNRWTISDLSRALSTLLFALGLSDSRSGNSLWKHLQHCPSLFGKFLFCKIFHQTWSKFQKAAYEFAVVFSLANMNKLLDTDKFLQGINPQSFWNTLYAVCTINCKSFGNKFDNFTCILLFYFIKLNGVLF